MAEVIYFYTITYLADPILLISGKSEWIDLESELSKMKAFQEDSNKTELEKYKQLYLEELKVRKSLANKLNK